MTAIDTTTEVTHGVLSELEAAIIAANRKPDRVI
jgi:hypothetical protein